MARRKDTKKRTDPLGKTMISFLGWFGKNSNSAKKKRAENLMLLEMDLGDFSESCSQGIFLHQD